MLLHSKQIQYRTVCLDAFKQTRATTVWRPSSSRSPAVSRMGATCIQYINKRQVSKRWPSAVLIARQWRWSVDGRWQRRPNADGITIGPTPFSVWFVGSMPENTYFNNNVMPITVEMKDVSSQWVSQGYFFLCLWINSASDLTYGGNWLLCRHHLMPHQRRDSCCYERDSASRAAIECSWTIDSRILNWMSLYCVYEEGEFSLLKLNSESVFLVYILKL